jgi:uncharacterized protein YndB with AHSA1/START domain
MEQAESEIVVDAPPEEAWEAITDPDRLGEWLGDEAEFDLRPGGGLEIEVGDEHRSGFVEEVDEPRRLVFWWSADDDESSRVEINLEPEENRTRVRVTETRPLRILDQPGVELETGIGGGTTPQMNAAPLALVG